MSNLMDSLDLGSVEADTNALPDGRWAGEVMASRYVHVKKDNSIAHVITYIVTEGERKGAQRQEWFKIGKDPVFEEGHDGDANFVVSLTPTMTDQQKPWYKKRFVDLGVPEEDVPSTKPEDLVGRQVTFGTKKNGEYINVSFVELRDVTASPSTGPVTGLI